MLIPRQSRVPSSRRRPVLRVAIPSFGLRDKTVTEAISSEITDNRAEVLDLFGSDLKQSLSEREVTPPQEALRNASK
ncbi:hypothetical protein [Pseudaestuariivita rosea]|uniref:hypothetical protein n=1 Tax=Pseudaestuariivita rosea TaxID=2763263 RepID=UPI001ABA95D4|nr:hypothetical protein [Pseudaestuariivita rosea]